MKQQGYFLEGLETDHNSVQRDRISEAISILTLI
jgi:hypothetical protein